MSNNIDEMMLADIARLWPAIKLIMNASKEQADAALKAFEDQFGKNESIEALFKLGDAFREEKAGME